MQEGFKQHEDVAVHEDKKLPENFEQAADLLIKEGDALMAGNHGPNGSDPKVYHTPENHIAPLQERARQMAEILGLTSEQQKLIAMEISWHDTIIEYDAPDSENIVGMVRRHRGAREGDKPMGAEGNEALSADAMVEAMKRINEDTKKIIFTEEHMRIGRYGIDATYPDVNLGADFKGAEFTQDPLYAEIAARNPAIGATVAYLNERGITKGPHFFQPHLENPLKQEEKVPEEVLVMAMSDLGASGIAANPEEFFIEGDNEGKESYHNMRKSENIERLLNGDTEKDQEDRVKGGQALLGWIHSQAGFAMWQMIRGEKIMNWLRENGQFDGEKEEKFRALFGNYEMNIKASVERDARIKKEYDAIKSEQGDKAAFAYVAGEMKLNS